MVRNPSFSKYRRIIERNPPEIREEVYKLYKKQEQKEAKKTAEEELYGRKIKTPKSREYGKFSKKALKKKFAPKKPLIKQKRVTVVINKREPAPYVSRYFKQEWEESKNNMFFK